MKKLFVEDLRKVKGGDHRDGHPAPPGKCRGITSLACGEEGACSAC